MSRSRAQREQAWIDCYGDGSFETVDTKEFEKILKQIAAQKGKPREIICSLCGKSVSFISDEMEVGKAFECSDCVIKLNKILPT